jgi:hypothetical protein
MASWKTGAGIGIPLVSKKRRFETMPWPDGDGRSRRPGKALGGGITRVNEQSGPVSHDFIDGKRPMVKAFPEATAKKGTSAHRAPGTRSLPSDPENPRSVTFPR